MGFVTLNIMRRDFVKAFCAEEGGKMFDVVNVYRLPGTLVRLGEFLKIFLSEVFERNSFFTLDVEEFSFSDFHLSLLEGLFCEGLAGPDLLSVSASLGVIINPEVTVLLKNSHSAYLLSLKKVYRNAEYLSSLLWAAHLAFCAGELSEGIFVYEPEADSFADYCQPPLYPSRIQQCA